MWSVCLGALPQCLSDDVLEPGFIFFMVILSINSATESGYQGNHLTCHSHRLSITWWGLLQCYFAAAPTICGYFRVYLTRNWFNLKSSSLQRTKGLRQSSRQRSRSKSPNLWRPKMKGFSRFLITRCVLKSIFHNPCLCCHYAFGVLNKCLFLTWLFSILFTDKSTTHLQHADTHTIV